MHRCVTRQAPPCLAVRLRTNAGIGRRMTRGHSKIFLLQASSYWMFPQILHFAGIKTWNSLIAKRCYKSEFLYDFQEATAVSLVFKNTILYMYAFGTYKIIGFCLCI